MSVSIYIKFTGGLQRVTPGIKKGPYAGWTQLESMNWSQSMQGAGLNGNGGGRMPTHISVIIPHDPSGPDLFTLAANGREIPEVTIDFVDNRKNPPLRYLQVVLKQVTVTGFQASGNGYADTRLIDVVSLSAVKVANTYAGAPTNGKSAALLQFDLQNRRLA